MNNTMTFVELDNYYSIAFLRFISKTPAVIDLIIIEFTSTVSCSQYRVFIRYPSEWDIFCKVDNAVNKLTIWWLTAARICSIYISGARKVMSVNFQVPYVTVSYRTASTSRTNSTADSTSSGSPGTETISPREVEIKTLVTSSPLPGSSSGAKKTSRLEESTGGQILGVTEENSTFGNTTRNNTMEISSMKNVAKRDLFSMCKLLSNDKNEKLSVTLNVEYVMYRLLITVLSLDNGTHAILFQFIDVNSYQQYNKTVALNLTQFQSHTIDIALVGLWAKTILISEVGNPASSFMSICSLNIYGGVQTAEREAMVCSVTRDVTAPVSMTHATYRMATVSYAVKNRWSATILAQISHLRVASISTDLSAINLASPVSGERVTERLGHVSRIAAHQRFAFCVLTSVLCLNMVKTAVRCVRFVAWDYVTELLECV
ncbi:uncharacterized protein LOC106068849 [Biomphalaria glabrata]|uniref:Uncharacterized protein LOC106068849 n=1 Tax=Biomphalaria glabrata TaxID=6526 RepID=A0A9W2Z679_BIOGL|nr:uncharacterized protein LOC106068849 [Biomphalaria glabrata]